MDQLCHGLIHHFLTGTFCENTAFNYCHAHLFAATIILIVHGQRIFKAVPLFLFQFLQIQSTRGLRRVVVHWVWKKPLLTVEFHRQRCLWSLAQSASL